LFLLDIGSSSGFGICDFPEFCNLFIRKYSQQNTISNTNETLDTNEIHELKLAFDTIDKNSDGIISIHELQQALLTLDGQLYDIEIIKEMIAEIDTEKKGEIDWKDFLQVMSA
jgi:Ca2+-binding EF-hand superfamily protein